MNRELKPLCRSVIAAILMSGVVTAVQPAYASTDSGWQPLSSEKLVRLPANYMDKSLQQNFRESALASTIEATETQVRVEAQRMRDLKSAIETAEGEERLDLMHQLLVSKSAYLELIQGKLALDKKALQTRTAVYERVMDKLAKDKRKASDPVTADLRARQLEARSRLENSVQQVDSLMAELGAAGESQYGQQYADNLSKIEQLKAAINRHVANEAPAIDGEEVSREDYVRHLLANTEAERGILDQESLMLTYMAKLVALDAQALEQELTYGGEESEVAQQSDPVRPATMVDEFVW